MKPPHHHRTGRQGRQGRLNSSGPLTRQRSNGQEALAPRPTWCRRSGGVCASTTGTSSDAWGGGIRPDMHCVRRGVEEHPRRNNTGVKGQAVGIPLDLVRGPVGQDADHPLGNPPPEKVANPRYPGGVGGEQRPVPTRIVLRNARPRAQGGEAADQLLIRVALSNITRPRA